MKDLDWRAPKGKVNVQVASTWAFIALVISAMAAMVLTAVWLIYRAL